MESAVLDSDALIEAYDLGIEKFSGRWTTYISLYEFLRVLSYMGKQVAEHKSHVEGSIEVLPLDNQAVLKASELYGALRKKGTLVDDPDLLIASACIAGGLPMVTGNVKHFERFKEFGLSLRPMDEFFATARIGRD